jgi:hypothetical protein
VNGTPGIFRLGQGKWESSKKRGTVAISPGNHQRADAKVEKQFCDVRAMCSLETA